jgi:N-[(2S)-2-amino-2-carboxyethyl]-L-glutamate dehydrogenase
MADESVLVLDSRSVAELLAGREQDVVDAVESAYAAHATGASAVPRSVFLRFPETPANRIIALPAYLGGEWHLAGIKWVSSFPANVDAGTDRASAVLVLNSADTGRPYAVLEGSHISAQRTAASAVLAARHLWGAAPHSHVGVIGCGVIAYEILRFLHLTVRPLRSVKAYDIAAGRASAFVERCAGAVPGASFQVAPSIAEAVSAADLIVFATTAAEPHVGERAFFAPGATVLHISLRDLAPELILAFDNVVDDPDHVCRSETSVHLAEQLRGGRDFIRATLADIVSGAAPPRRAPDDVVVFSPFGLGVLDLAVGQLVFSAAMDLKKGVRIPSFLPPSWQRCSDATAAPQPAMGS